MLIFQATAPLFDPQVFAGVKTIYQIRFDREYIQSHPRRGIAEEPLKKQ